MHRLETNLKQILLYCLLVTGIIPTHSCTAYNSFRPHIYIVNVMDVAITYYAVKVDKRFEEANPLTQDLRIIATLKIATIFTIEILAYHLSYYAETLYSTAAMLTYLAVIINIYVLVYGTYIQPITRNMN